MKIGSLVFATCQGLGVLAKSFYDAGIITHPVIVRHGRRETHAEWYPPDTPQVSDFKPNQIRQLKGWCRKMDVMLFFETPFVWELIPWCRQEKTKTVLMPMYECMPKQIPEHPDLYLCPSMLDFRYYPNCGEHPGMKSTYLPVPVDVPWRQRTKAEVFVHNAGHGGLKGRNGTKELLESLQYIQSYCKINIYSQVPLPEAAEYLKHCKPYIDVLIGTRPYETLWRSGDVFVFPEKFNGLSLPLQEAYAAGMLVVATDRFPNNTYLPNAPLIPVSGYRKNRVAERCNEFDEAIVDPKDIAAAIDQWHGADITGASQLGKEYAEQNSWEVLKPKYMEVLCG